MLQSEPKNNSTSNNNSTPNNNSTSQTSLTTNNNTNEEGLQAKGLRDILSRKEIERYKQAQIEKYHQQQKTPNNSRDELPSQQRAFKTRLEFQKNQRAQNNQNSTVSTPSEPARVLIPRPSHDSGSLRGSALQMHSKIQIPIKQKTELISTISRAISKSFMLIDENHQEDTNSNSNSQESPQNFVDPWKKVALKAQNSPHSQKKAEEKQKKGTVLMFFPPTQEEEQNTLDFINELEESASPSKELLDSLNRLEDTADKKALLEQNPHIVQLFENVYEDHLAKVEAKMKMLLCDQHSRTMDELNKMNQQIHQISKENEPIQQDFYQKQQLLFEQKQIQSQQATKKFYLNFEKKFSAKIIAALTLTSGMIKREQSKTEKVGRGAAAVIGGILGGLPFVGGIIGGLSNYIVDESTNQTKKWFQKKKEREVFNVIGDFHSAIEFGEMVARRLTQSYLRFMVDKNADPKICGNAGKFAALEMYKIMYSDILDAQIEEEIQDHEDKIILLVAAFHQKFHQIDLFFPKMQDNLLLTPSEEAEYKKFRSKKKLDLPTKLELLNQHAQSPFSPHLTKTSHLSANNNNNNNNNNNHNNNSDNYNNITPSIKMSNNSSISGFNHGYGPNSPAPPRNSEVEKLQARKIVELETKLNQQQQQIDNLQKALEQVLKRDQEKQ